MYLVDFVVILFVFSCRAATVTCRPTDDDANSNELRTLSEQMLRLVDVENIPHLTDAALPVPDYMTVLYRDIEESESSHHTPHSGSVWGLQPRAETFSRHYATLTFRSLRIVADEVTKVELVYPPLRHSQRSRSAIHVCEDDNTRCVAVGESHRKRFYGKTEDFDVYNVTDAFVRWLAGPGSTERRNDSFIVRVRGGHGSRPRTIGGALLVVYQDIAPGFHSSWSLATVKRRSMLRERRSIGDSKQLSSSYAFANSNQLQPSDCQLHQWYVPFSRLGWSDWIIDPKGYTANFCGGECAEPLMNRNLNATNHSFIKSLYRARVGMHNTADIPSAQCVPIRLSPINLLFRREDTMIVIRHLVEMVADRCGCM